MKPESSRLQQEMDWQHRFLLTQVRLRSAGLWNLWITTDMGADSLRQRRHLKCYLSHKFSITGCGELSNHTINDTRIQLTTTPTSQPDSLPSVIGMIRTYRYQRPLPCKAFRSRKTVHNPCEMSSFYETKTGKLMTLQQSTSFSGILRFEFSFNFIAAQLRIVNQIIRSAEEYLVSLE
ncbi:hypothetical protein DAPPUDRAFT_239029 [Daphnia pulex]|uniref:Uncharacterized protein n=1 Tax=Daphnia pulex TaxID=6669 RepID=E9G856_DAPPU|nr:hypothetical protein DAPPUDRAFT_239029 [Daphnia pulex]|eukprot:EFX84331.1 hypothetical protein DAPPUDRAFT_239029 [Daphnia pulex]